MPLIQAVILALVQAFTEFLPVSSTAHLVLFPWLLHWQDPGEAFDVALHAGTLLAVILYFFKDWWTLLVCGLGGKYPAGAPPAEVAQHKKLFWYMVVGTIPGGILGKLFDKPIEEHLRTPMIIGVSMILVAFVMWWADSRKDLTRKLEQSNLGDAVGIGAAQAVALWPGVSRSGITISAGAVAAKLPALIKLHKAGSLELPLSTLAISIVISGITGYLVIAFFLRY